MTGCNTTENSGKELQMALSGGGSRTRHPSSVALCEAADSQNRMRARSMGHRAVTDEKEREHATSMFVHQMSLLAPVDRLHRLFFRQKRVGRRVHVAQDAYADATLIAIYFFFFIRKTMSSCCLLACLPLRYDSAKRSDKIESSRLLIYSQFI